MFFCFSQSLFRVVFLKISLKTVYLASGIDGKRFEKVGKGWKRCKKVGIDSVCIREYGFSCVANAHVLPRRGFPYLVGIVGFE